MPAHALAIAAWVNALLPLGRSRGRLGHEYAICVEAPLSCRAFAIRDNYPFWKSRNERSHAGKLFFLDPRDKDTLKIFFDDNIGHTAAHIVDVRDVRTGKLIPFQVAHLHMGTRLLSFLSIDT